MSFSGRLGIQGIVPGATPGQAITLQREGNLVVPPFGGPMARFPAALNPLNYSILMDDFYRFEAAGTSVGGWDVDAIANGLSVGPIVTAYAPGPAFVGPSGLLSMAPANASGDGACAQWDVDGCVYLTTSLDAWFETLLLLGGADTHVRVGWMADTSNPFSSAPNGAYFFYNETGSYEVDTYTKNAAGATQNSDVATGLVSTALRLSMFWSGGDSTLKYFVNGTRVAKVTTTLPTSLALTPTIAIKNITEGTSTHVMMCDYIFSATTRTAAGVYYS